MNSYISRMISNPQQLCYARRSIVADGPAAGERMIECGNGKISFTLTENRCLDVLRLDYRGTNIAFLSKNGYTNVPGEFVNRFPGGMIFTCGLDSLSLRPGHVMHGRVHDLPADSVTVRDGEALEISGVMTDSALFAQHLELHRTITTEYNSSRLTLHDKLINRGYKDADYALLYHINMGYPFLTPALTIEGDFGQPHPSTDHAAKFVSEYTHFAEPEDDSFEQVFFHDERSGKVRMVSPETGLAMTIEYTRDTLPCLTEWKAPLSGDYALRIEPATSYMADRFTYRIIAPGQEIEFEVTLDFEELK